LTVCAARLELTASISDANMHATLLGIVPSLRAPSRFAILRFAIFDLLADSSIDRQVNRPSTIEYRKSSHFWLHVYRRSHRHSQGFSARFLRFSVDSCRGGV